MGSRLWLRSLAVLASLPLIQCGTGDSVSSKIEMELIPKSPIVILSDFTLNPGADNEKTITGPWFAIAYKITNKSDKDIVVQSLRFKVTALTTSGSTTTKEIGVDPADYEDYFCPVLHDPTYLDAIPAGATIYAGGDTTAPCFLIYISGLEKNVQTYSYQVEVMIEGWVGTPTQPVDRLSKSVYFATQ